MTRSLGRIAVDFHAVSMLFVMICKIWETRSPYEVAKTKSISNSS